jgi:hypothetical protein
VLPAPLAHATFSETALTPRNRTVTPEVCAVHEGAKTTAAATAVAVT